MYHFWLCDKLCSCRSHVWFLGGVSGLLGQGKGQEVQRTRSIFTRDMSKGRCDAQGHDSKDGDGALSTVAHGGEASLLRCFPSPPLYGAILMASPSAILALVPPEMLCNKIVQKTFHVTTIYIGRGHARIDPALLRQLIELRGTSIELTLTRVVSDPKGTAIAVRNDGEFPCQNIHPHITIANAKGVSPVYSNELLDDSHADDPCRTVLDLPAGTRATGTFDFVF